MLGFACDRILDEILPDELQWLVDLGCAGLDAATGNYAGTAALGLKAVSSGARAAGNKDIGEAFDYASDAAGIIAADPMSAPRCEGPVSALASCNPSRLPEPSKARLIATKAAATGAGAAMGAAADGKEGAKAGMKAGGAVASTDPLGAASGAAGVCIGAIVAAVKGKGAKDFTRGFEVGIAAGSVAGAAVSINPGEDKKSILRAAALFSRTGTSLAGSIDAAARPDDSGRRAVDLTARAAAGALTAVDSAQGATCNSKGPQRVIDTMETARSIIATGLDAASLAASHGKSHKDLDKAREIFGTASTLAEQLWINIDKNAGKK
jgi:hypothetical protein